MTPRDQVCNELEDAVSRLEREYCEDPNAGLVGCEIVSLEEVFSAIRKVRAFKPAKRPDVGRIVEWTSGAAGSMAKKTGIVAAVVPPGHRPSREQFPSLYRGYGCGHGRSEISFVVLVNKKVYWPRTVALTWKD